MSFNIENEDKKEAWVVAAVLAVWVITIVSAALGGTQVKFEDGHFGDNAMEHQELTKREQPMSNKHFTSATSSNSEEVVTEDGKYKYWREALPLPFYRTRWTRLGRTSYDCACKRSFGSKAEYEVHWRKAFAEEKHLAETKDGA